MSEDLKGYVKYLKYIRNTARRPLAISAFDNDWNPIGPLVRCYLVRYGLIEECLGALMLTDKGEGLLP